LLKQQVALSTKLLEIEQKKSEGSCPANE